MPKKDILTEIIEEDYNFLKDEIIRIMGYTKMFCDSCRSITKIHAEQLKNKDLKQVINHRDKADFICDKFDELYRFLIKDYPNPMNKER